MSHNSRDDISVQQATHESRQRVLKEHFVEDLHMLGLYYPIEPLVLRPSVLEEEPKIQLPEVETIVAPDGHKYLRYKTPLSPEQKRYAQKIIRDRLPDAAVDDLNNWTERTQARLDELAKKLEI